MNYLQELEQAVIEARKVEEVKLACQVVRWDAKNEDSLPYMEVCARLWKGAKLYQFQGWAFKEYLVHEVPNQPVVVICGGLSSCYSLMNSWDTAWKLPLVDNGERFDGAWYSPSGKGDLIFNPDNFSPIGEVVGNTVYVFAGILGKTGPQILEKILAEAQRLKSASSEEKTSLVENCEKEAQKLFERMFVDNCERRFERICSVLHGRIGRNDTWLKDLASAYTEVWTQKEKELSEGGRSSLHTEDQGIKLKRQYAQAVIESGKAEQRLREMAMISANEWRERFVDQYHRIVGLKEVDCVKAGAERLKVETKTLYCQDPRPGGALHEIGAFSILIEFKSEDRWEISWKNLHREVDEQQAPLIGPFDRYGIPPLATQLGVHSDSQDYFELVNLAISYVTSVFHPHIGYCQGWEKQLQKWPVATEQ